MSHTPSPFVWYELMTTDAPAARAFYTAVVGWKAADAGMPGMDYTLLSVAETSIAGLMPLPADALAAGGRPGWVGYIASADVDAQAASIARLGGSICHPATDIPGVGRFAAMTDPQGAAFCLFKGSSDDAPPPLPAGSVGTVGWHELQAGDLDSAWAFYSAQFGWAKDTAIDMGPVGTYQLFTAGGPAIGGMMTKQPESPAPFWLYYVNVEAIDAAVARVLAGGGQIVNGPMQVPGGSWIVNAIDPQGAMFALVAARR
jgi:hypothetical protein